MDTVIVTLQVVIALGILNVWVVRAGMASSYRGGAAASLKDEFAAYGLPAWAMGVIGTLKLLCAGGLLAGIWMTQLVQPAAALLGMLMLGAIVMHLKVTDPMQRSVPALLMLAGCVTVVAA
jgi:hypothetical protein